MALKRIGADSVHKICSGQVVLTLAIAVKELVENSLDAGATSIEVRLKNSGIEVVEVIDNGSGIKPENYQALTLKHFTSKITNFDDVAFVETFGFRGEALSSLCALSNLVVVTRHGNQQVGSRIEYDNEGKVTAISKCARETGTTVILRNLFHSLPVRQKEFQRNIKKEYGRMVRLLQGYALITENVRISCYNQQSGSNTTKRQLILSSLPSCKMIDNISCIFGPKQVDQLVPFVQCSNHTSPPVDEGEGESPIVMTPDQLLPFDSQDLFNISGYVSKCTHGYGRSTTDRQFFFLNGRPCDHQKLSKAVNEVYHMFNRHQYPFVCLNIKTNTRDKVDVNVTPDKRTVLIQEEKQLLTIIKDSLIVLYDPMQGQIQSTPSIPLSFTSSCSATPSSSATPIDSISPATPDGLALLTTPTDSTSSVTPADSTSSATPTNSTSSATPPLTDLSLSATPTDLPSSATPTDTTVIDHISTSCNDPMLATPLSPPTSQSSNDPIDLTRPSNNGLSGLQRFSHQSSPSIVSKHAPKSKQPKLTDFSISKATPTNPSSGSIGHHTTKSKLTPKPSTTSIKGVWSPANGKEYPQTKVNEHISATEKQSIKTTDVNIDVIDSRQRWLADHYGNGSCHSNSERKYFRAKIMPDSNEQAEDELKKELKKNDFKEMEVIGQFNLGFIVAKLGDHLFIIDQHATDEKYNYERFQRDTVIKHQTLIQPLPLELTTVGESVVMENEEIFAKNGFYFQLDENAPPTKRVKLVGQPVSKKWSMGVSEIEELIFLLTDYPGEMVRPSCVNKMFAMRACRGSIMIGTSLNQKEMRRLLVHMSEMDQPWNCPHGRPTLRHLLDLSKLTY